MNRFPRSERPPRKLQNSTPNFSFSLFEALEISVSTGHLFTLGDFWIIILRGWLSFTSFTEIAWHAPPHVEVYLKIIGSSLLRYGYVHRLPPHRAPVWSPWAPLKELQGQTVFKKEFLGKPKHYRTGKKSLGIKGASDTRSCDEQ